MDSQQIPRRVASHRADVTILECAKAGAALAGRDLVTIDDVVEAGAMALGHRLQSDPFAPPADLDTRDVRRILESVLDAEVEAKKAGAPATAGPTPGSTTCAAASGLRALVSCDEFTGSPST